MLDDAFSTKAQPPPQKKPQPLPLLLPLTWSRASLEDAPSTGLMSEAIDSEERRSPRTEVETVVVVNATGARPMLVFGDWNAERAGSAGSVVAASSVDEAERRKEALCRTEEGRRAEEVPNRAEPAGRASVGIWDVGVYYFLMKRSAR